MKIAVIGTGNVGSTLGRRWAEKGHEVVFGVRDPKGARVSELLDSISGVGRAAAIPQAVSECPVVTLAVPWAAAANALRVAGDLGGKILIDCTNPIKESFAGLSIGQSTSAAEQVAAWAPGARVVKAFNTTGRSNLENPVYGDQRLTMFVCGDEAEAKQTALELATELDFEAVDAGPLHAARYLEPLAMLWINLAYSRGLGTEIGFRLLRR